MSPAILTFPDNIPLGDFNVCALAGPIVATGRPRFVTVTVLPFSSISSSRARHLALNSVAPMTRVFMRSSYLSPVWSSDQFEPWSAQHLARQRLGHLPAIDHRDTVHQHILHPRGKLIRILE